MMRGREGYENKNMASSGHNTSYAVLSSHE